MRTTLDIEDDVLQAAKEDPDHAFHEHAHARRFEKNTGGPKTDPSLETVLTDAKRTRHRA
jgi:hypothetical protein